jgi:hypothetical protein
MGFSYKSGRSCPAAAPTVTKLLYSGNKQVCSYVGCNISISEKSMSAILTSPSDGERRQVERKPLSVRVRLALAGKPEVEVRSVDISHSGMSVVVEVNLSPGTTCNLAFTLPQPDSGQHKAQVAAVIAHCTYSSKRSGFVIGLQFKGVSADLQAALARYVRG